jgi:hypothetical protein
VKRIVVGRFIPRFADVEFVQKHPVFEQDGIPGPAYDVAAISRYVLKYAAWGSAKCPCHMKGFLVAIEILVGYVAIVIQKKGNKYGIDMTHFINHDKSRVKFRQVVFRYAEKTPQGIGTRIIPTLVGE